MTSERLFTRLNKQRLMKAAGKRFSCRSFTGTASLDDWAMFSYLAQRYTLPGARIVLMRCDDGLFIAPTQGKEKRISGCSQMAVLVFDRNVENSIVNAGFLGEAFVLELVDKGFGTCWIGESYRRHALNLTLSADEIVCAVIAFGRPGIGSTFSRNRKPMYSFCMGDAAQWAPDFRRVAEAVQTGPSNRNSQPWSMAANGMFSLTIAASNGLELGIVQCHAELAADFPHFWQYRMNDSVCQVRLERKVRA